MLAASLCAALGSISGDLKQALKQAAACLTGFARRKFQAQVAQQYCQASPRKTESMFGWCRKAVGQGIQEAKLGKPLKPQDERRGRPRVESLNPRLISAVDRLTQGHTCADPKFQSPLAFTRITAKALRQALAQDLQLELHQLPAQRTLRRLLNRMKLSLRKVRKTLPLKKTRETNAIFKNVHRAHAEAREDPHTLRVSIDTKAKVKIGPFSRDGKTRLASQAKAADHDMGEIDLLIPCGILEVDAAQLSIGFGRQVLTSDLIMDNLERWWQRREATYSSAKKLMIDLDNGPEVNSHRTQFMKRMVEFCDTTGFQIELVYYPPYHSKYNLIERCWGVLEQHWNGTLLSSVNLTLQWARTMTWKGLYPIVDRFENLYQRGVTLGKRALRRVEQRLERRQGLEAWSVLIQPLKQRRAIANPP